MKRIGCEIRNFLINYEIEIVHVISDPQICVFKNIIIKYLITTSFANHLCLVQINRNKTEQEEIEKSIQHDPHHFYKLEKVALVTIWHLLNCARKCMRKPKRIIINHNSQV